MMQWILREAADYVREGLEPLGYKVRYPEEVIRDRLSVFLSASHPVTHGSWPYPPNVIEVGGMHLKDPKTLPRNLKKFMDSAARGVVYVSFGSTIKPSQMPKKKLSAFIETFKRLEESVLWKWDADIQDLPENVLTSSWVPQQDVLGHPNLKVFVTHGGMGSVMEAIHHKAKILGIPLLNDQRPNLKRAARHGNARMLEWSNLTAAGLTSAIRDVIDDDKMGAAAESVHSIYVDRQHRPVDTAVWWMEYSVRHEGADILHSTLYEDSPWYQFHHVDVAAFAVAVLAAICSAIALFFYFCCKIVCCRTKVKTE